MSQPISCNFARCAIYHFTTKHENKMHRLPKGSYAKILQDYNQHFGDIPTLKATYNLASKKFDAITKSFGCKWHPNDAKQSFLSTFSLNEWQALASEEKSKHTLKGCEECKTKYETLTKSFPRSSHKRKVAKSPQICFNTSDLSTPKQFGSKLLQEANELSEAHFQKPTQQLLEQTPESKLLPKPSSTERLCQKRQILREIKKQIEDDMNSQGDSLVLQNRISWNKFDDLRKTQGLDGTKRKRPCMTENAEEEPPTKRRHGCLPSNLNIDKDELLREARTWESNKQVNWSQLGMKYGLTMANRGQMIKEYLAEQGIQAALTQQRKARAPRRCKKRLSGGKISFPMYMPVKKLQHKVTEKIQSGEIPVGEEVVSTTYASYTASQGELRQTSSKVHARKIPLREIRERLLTKHEELGILRQKPDEYYTNLNEDEVKAALTELHETIDPSTSVEDLRQKLKTLSRQRLLKVWHNHSGLAGHSHLLVLVAVVYDPALFLTPKEVQRQGRNIDVQTVVEEPQIHIFGRSSSALEDQTQFIETRKECLLDLGEELHTKAGTPIIDMMRYFHGDGPAMQFEAGNKVGGNYSCVGCEAHNTRYDNLAYCFRAKRLTLAERQEFIFQGEAWRHSRLNPQDKLKVAELRTELEKRGVKTAGKKPQLERELEGLQKGVSNVPALLQCTPQASLENLNLGTYEVLPVEPLHDLKGHLHNIIEETINKASGETLVALKDIKDTALSKCTLRCSDYRKVVILIYKTLQEISNPDPQFLELFRTATEISEIMYAPESRRTPKAILRFHNLTYQHGKVCTELFTRGSTKTPVFGRYFHSITCHSPLVLRLLSLRLVNTEVQERMFGQAKQITASTSSLKPNHVITNYLVRSHAEATAQNDPLAIQEGEIHQLAQTLGSTTNTVIPYSWITHTPTLHQAHLERISDFLLPGPGVWWRYTQDGIEFLDGHGSPSQQPEGPNIHHIRSASLSDVDIYLHLKWKECCTMQTQLPAKYVRHYTSDGALTMITFQPEHEHSEGTQEAPDETENQQRETTQHLPSPEDSSPPSFPPSESQRKLDSPQPPFQCTNASVSRLCDTQPQTLVTSLAKTISEVLPNSSTLRQFDLLRSKAKQVQGRPNRQLTQLAKHLEQTLISKFKELSAVIKSWKTEDMNLCFSHTNTECPNRIENATRKLNIIRKVLQHEWKLDMNTVHTEE